MEESRNRGAMLRLAETPQGLRALQYLGAGGNGGTTNRLAIGPGNGPHAGGSGGRVFDVSLHQVPYYETLEANSLITAGRLVAIVALTIFVCGRCSKFIKQIYGSMIKH